MIAFFPGLILACDTTIQTVGHMEPDFGCLVVIHSHFVGASAPNGGAINLGLVSDATISDSSFYSCTATSRGGAIYGASANTALDLYGCCAFKCTANIAGNFIYGGIPDNMLVSLLETSMVQCSTSQVDGTGGIYLTHAIGLEMKCFNASSCKGYSYGTVWTCTAGTETPVHFSLSYMNILECSGPDYIGQQSMCESVSSISYSNFYQNSPGSSTKGVVTHETNRNVPLAVEYCIFRDTQNNALDLYVTGLGTLAKFTVSGCVFSGTYSRAYCTDAGGNKENTDTDSYRLNVINTHECGGINAASKSPQ
jgi:hypothetical protein